MKKAGRLKNKKRKIGKVYDWENQDWRFWKMPIQLQLIIKSIQFQF